MSLLNLLTEQYLLTEADVKKIVTQKIGLDEKVFNIIKENVSKKFIIFVANLVKKYYDTVTDSGVKLDRPMIIAGANGVVSDFKEFHENVLKQQNRPKINIKQDIKDLAMMQKYTEEWNSIRDWRNTVTPTPQLHNMEWEEAYYESVQWHEELKNNKSGLSKDLLDIAPDAEIIHKFDDGYSWVDLKTNRCSGLSDEMGHCASTGADTLLNLITDKGEYVVTVAFDYDGTYYQMKGTGNTKPVKYEPWIKWLFTTTGEYQLTAKKDEYDSSHDFTVEDIEDDTLREELIDENPELQGGITYERIMDQYREDGDEEKAIEKLDDWADYYGSRAVLAILNDGDFVIDYEMDDYSEYLASLFEFKKFYNTDISEFFEEENPEPLDVHYLISRNKIDQKTESLYDKVIQNAKDRYGNTRLAQLDWNMSTEEIIKYIDDTLKISSEAYAGELNKDAVQDVKDLMNSVIEYLGGVKYTGKYYYNLFIDEYSFDEDDHIKYQFTEERIVEDIDSRTYDIEDAFMNNPKEEGTFEELKKLIKYYSKEFDKTEHQMIMAINHYCIDDYDPVFSKIDDYLKHDLLTPEDVREYKKDPSQQELQLEITDKELEQI